MNISPEGAIVKNQIKGQFRSLIESSLHPTLTISLAGIITDCNEASNKIIGLTREDLLTADFLTFFTEPNQAQSFLQEIFSKGSLANFPLTIQHPDGQVT